MVGGVIKTYSLYTLPRWESIYCFQTRVGSAHFPSVRWIWGGSDERLAPPTKFFKYTPESFLTRTKSPDIAESDYSNPFLDLEALWLDRVVCFFVS